MYGPTAKQLSRMSAHWVLPQERLDTDGWYSDGVEDARSGRECNYGSCVIKANQDAYLAGYKSVKVEAANLTAHPVCVTITADEK